MGIPRFAWGIDVGNRALKAIRLVRDGDQFRIDDFEVIEHEQIISQAGDNRDSMIQIALANFAQKHNAKGGEVAIGVSGQASFARFIKLPPVDPSKIADIVKFEAVQQIPFPLEDVEWSYQLFQAPDSPEVEVGIFAMRRELVNQIIKNFTDVKLEVNVVQMNPLAVYNGLIYDKRIEGTTMIVDVGSENSDLIIADGESIWMRSIPIGGNNFTEALIKSFKLKFAKAEELKRNAATSKYGRQILQAMKPVFSDLVGEIQRSIGFYSSTHRDSRIGKVLALGGTFRLPGLQKYLQQNLQLEVARIDRLNAPMPPDARFSAAFNENILSSLGAYGLALQAMGQAKVTSSLLPEKIRRERMWREKTRWFGVAASLFVAGTAIAVGKLYADSDSFNRQTEANKGRIASVSSQAKKLDGDWREIENSGADDREHIKRYVALLNDRDISIAAFQALTKPFVRPEPAELNKLLAMKRGERKVVELVGWKVHYEPDVSEWVAHQGADTMNDNDFKKRDDEFIQKAEKIDLNAGTIGTFNFHSPSDSGNNSTGMRGFIVTLLCKTPYVNPTSLVHDMVVEKLKEGRLAPVVDQENNRAAPAVQYVTPGSISIERVTITKQEMVSKVYGLPNGTAHTKNPPLVFTLPGENNNNGASNLPPLKPDPETAYADPMIKGENVMSDWLVTVLAVVVIDPPKKVALPQQVANK